jgi:hypothetical protein
VGRDGGALGSNADRISSIIEERLRVSLWMAWICFECCRASVMTCWNSARMLWWSAWNDRHSELIEVILDSSSASLLLLSVEETYVLSLLEAGDGLGAL